MSSKSRTRRISESGPRADPRMLWRTTCFETWERKSIAPDPPLAGAAGKTLVSLFFANASDPSGTSAEIIALKDD